MKGFLSLALAILVLVSAPVAARAQDLYDTTILRNFAFQFNDANWEALLRSNYAAQVNIRATLTVDGVSYPNVGVRIRGNTSYTALPTGSQKFSLNVDMDDVVADQTIMGYKALNLNNAFHDPTFCREVLYNNFAAQYLCHPRSNLATVSLNGANWGVYANVQQFDKVMLARNFADTSGLRIKCANNPSGPGLRYNGATQSGYTGYEIKDDGGLADPWAPLIDVCNAVTNGVVANWQTTIDNRFAIDPSSWSVVLENMLSDDDSYVNKGADFVTYRNPTDGRMVLLQTDANETFTITSWSPVLNFTGTAKPFLSHTLAYPELRQRYLAHYRTVKSNLSWTYFEPRATALRTLIDAAVQADPKKLYSYAIFQANFTSQVTLPYSGPAGGTVPGLQQFVNDRNTTLNANAELVAASPAISAVVVSDSTPDPAQPVSVTATATPATGGSISKVELWYRPSPTGVYQRVVMPSIGGNQYRVTLPITGASGQKVLYYVVASAGNTYLSQTYFPERAEYAPLSLEYTFGASGGMRITEFMYSGTTGEFVEFTNISASPVDMTGWSYDDDHALSGAFSLSAFGTVAPGESVVLTEATAAAFRTAWGLPATVKVIGGLGSATTGGGNNLARADQINLYNAAGVLSDRLNFGDQVFTGTIRTQNVSGQTCRQFIGQNDITGWVRSAVGDAYGSHTAATGEVGSPGVFISRSCHGCTADFNGDGDIGTDQDIEAFFACLAGNCCATCDPNGSDFNGDGDFGTDQDIEAFFRVLAGGNC